MRGVLIPVAWAWRRIIRRGESRHGLARQAHARLAGRAAEQRAIEITGDAGGRDVGSSISLPSDCGGRHSVSGNL